MGKAGCFLDLLNLDISSCKVIALVGGGGKTSLIYRLCQELREMKKRVIIATTTHMAYDPSLLFARDGQERRVKALLLEQGYVMAGGLDEEKGKYTALSMEKLEKLAGMCDVMLVEADGAKHMPLKVPEEWEPVIPPFAQAVVGVAGLDCLGKAICEIGHRPKSLALFLKKDMDAPVTSRDVAKIAVSSQGLFKDVGDRIYRVYLNKADTLKDLGTAEKIAEEIRKEGVYAVWGSVQKEDFAAWGKI